MPAASRSSAVMPPHKKGARPTSSPFWMSPPPAGVRLVHPSHGQAHMKPLWPSGDGGSSILPKACGSGAGTFGRDVCCLQWALRTTGDAFSEMQIQHSDSTVCVRPSLSMLEWKGVTVHPPSSWGPTRTRIQEPHHQNFPASLNTFRSYLQQQVVTGDLQLDLGCE